MKLNPVVVKPLTVSKYALVKSSSGFPLLNTLFQMNGIIRTSGRTVKVASMSQRDVCSSSSLRSANELNTKPTPNERKHVATKLLTAWISPASSPIAIGKTRSKPIICRKNPKLEMILRLLSKLQPRLGNIFFDYLFKSSSYCCG